MSKGVIPVAILSTATFDATGINPSTILFGSTAQAAPVQPSQEDVDGDRDIDLILQLGQRLQGW